MKIGILTDSIDGKFMGIGTYTYNLIRELNRLSDTDTLYLIHHTPSDLDIYAQNEEILIDRRSFRYGADLCWRFIESPLRLRSHDYLDLVHDPYGIGPLTFSMPFSKVITIADIIPVLFPETFSFSAAFSHRILLPRTLESADRILTPSQSTKHDLMTHFHVPAEHIKVAYPAVDEKYQVTDGSETRAIIAKYGLPTPFILYVGTLEPRKNIPAILNAVSLLKKKGEQYHLVIAGKKGWKYQHIFELVHSLGIEKETIFTGYVPEADLPGLYNAAEIMVWPSFYEGFGLPPLEAMACGTPVITSNTSSLPEVVGEAGIMVDPHDNAALAASIESLMKDGDLRREMSRKGIVQAKKFSKQRFASEILHVYREIT